MPNDPTSIENMIEYLSKLTLRELRRRQDILQQQMSRVTHTTNPDTVKRMQDMETALMHAVMKKTAQAQFQMPHEFRPTNPEPHEPEGGDEKMEDLGRDPTTEQLVKLDDGETLTVDEVITNGYLPMLRSSGSSEYYVAKDSETAGAAVRQIWQDRIDTSKEEFIEMIGQERLLQWALGESDNFGISSVREFLDAVANDPGQELASYDGNEVSGEISAAVAELLDIPAKNGWAAVLLYRTN